MLYFIESRSFLTGVKLDFFLIRRGNLQIVFQGFINSDFILLICCQTTLRVNGAALLRKRNFKTFTDIWRDRDRNIMMLLAFGGYSWADDVVWTVKLLNFLHLLLKLFKLVIVNVTK